MTSHDGARRASALYAALCRNDKIGIDSYYELFMDPTDFMPIVDDRELDEDSLRRARDRAVEDLRAIGIEVEEIVSGGNRFLTISNQKDASDALLLQIPPQQNNLRLNLATWLRRLHPNNGVRFDEGALAKQYLHNQIEIGYNGEIFQGVPYGVAFGARSVLKMSSLSGDYGFHVDSITSFKVVKRNVPRVLDGTIEPETIEGKPGGSLRSVMARGRQSDVAVLALAYRVIGAVQAEYSDEPIAWSVLERATGETEAMLRGASRVVEGLDSSIQLTDEGYEMDSDRHKDGEEDTRIDGGAALVSRLHARAFEALGASGRLEIFSYVEGNADVAAALEETFNELVSNLDAFLTRLDSMLAPVQAECGKSILATFNPDADEPWVNSYPLSVSIRGSNDAIEIRPTGLLWKDDRWWVQRWPPESGHVDQEIALDAITSCE